MKKQIGTETKQAAQASEDTGSEQPIYGVIMAGGVGSRLWPRSREASPKQMLHIMGEGTMIQNTVARLQPLIPPERILIVTNRQQIDGLSEQVPAIPPENFIAEPFGRNTAPCIGLAACAVMRQNDDGVMIVLPADHHIENVREFQNRLRVAAEVATSRGGLVTLGIRPTRPETGYGYIQWSEDRRGIEGFYEQGVRKVRTFAEKPDATTAERFLKSGDFLWNSGMFIWKAGTIMESFEKWLPDLYRQLREIDEASGEPRYDQHLESVYQRITPISIDYGVMEKAREVYVLQCEFGWSDVGSWDETYRLSRKDSDDNLLQGEVVAIDTTGSFVQSSDRMIATIGMKNVIVIDTPDALLICDKGRTQEVQKVVDYLRRKKITSLL